MNDQTMLGAAQPIELQPMQRLADRLIGMVPQPASPALPQPSPAVAAALARSGLQAQAAARRANRMSWSGKLFLPYSLVALVLRLLIARVFFLDGQTRIEGPRLAFSIPGFDFHGFGLRGFDLSVVLPLQVKVTTVAAVFDSLESAMLSTMIAYAICYATFILPIMLVLGLGTRFVAAMLLGVTVLMQLYVMPQALWSAPVYWSAILLVLISLGAGKISGDQIIRLLARR